MITEAYGKPIQTLEVRSSNLWMFKIDKQKFIFIRGDPILKEEKQKVNLFHFKARKVASSRFCFSFFSISIIFLLSYAQLKEGVLSFCFSCSLVLYFRNFFWFCSGMSFYGFPIFEFGFGLPFRLICDHIINDDTIWNQLAVGWIDPPFFARF